MIATRRRQTIAPLVQGALRLSGSEARFAVSNPTTSPYFQLTDPRRVGSDRDIRLIETLMINTYVVRGFQQDGSSYAVFVDFIDPADISVTDRELLDLSFTGVVDDVTLRAAALVAIGDFTTTAGYTITHPIWPFALSTANRSFANPTRSLNTAFLVSSTRDAQVSYTGQTSNSLSLSGGTQGTDYLEYADDSGFTTSVVEIGRAVSSNTGSLTIGLNTVQISSWNLSGIVPTGKYARVRSQNNTGTPTHTLLKAQEVLI